MTGLHLAQYRIDAELGRGGMGIVYRATDTKLDRTVAVKVLPPHALASEEDRARFYREAKAAAQLSHPNIATVFQVDEAEVEGTARPFIAMEYIDGESLSEHTAKGPLKLEEAVSIATQIAEALKAAHAKNIVHRDIKSQNVMLTKDGVAKVLDFGLAKTAASTKLTRQGSTMGTVAYMSPEQARGDEVDGRTDLYSLGTVLYEMIAGRLPFGAEYEQAVVYSILNEDPEPLTAIRTGVPMELERITNKLLAKQVTRRYQTAADLVADLTSVDPSVMTTSIRTRAASVPGRSDSRSTRAVMAGVVLILVAAAAFFVGRTTRDEAEPLRPVQRFEIPLPGASGAVQFPAVSPDGSLLAYAVGDPLGAFIRHLADGRTDSLGPPGGWLRFSPSGRYLFSWLPPQIRPVSGGAPKTITDRPSGEGCWLGDDSFVLQVDNELWLYPPDGGDLRQITHLDSLRGETEHESPVWIPGTRSVVFRVSTAGGDSLAVLDIDGGPHRIIGAGALPIWVPSGHLLYIQGVDSYSGQLMAQPFDARSMRFSGSSVVVRDSVVGVVLHIDGQGNLWDGTGGAVANRRFLLRFRQNEMRPDTVSGAHPVEVRIGPRGDVAALAGESGLRLIDLDTGTPTSLPITGQVRRMTWSADGKELLLLRDSRAESWSMVDQSLEESLDFRGSGELSWSESSGRAVLGGNTVAYGPIYLYDMATNTATMVESAEVAVPRISPDGEYLAFVEGSRRERPTLVVRKLDGAAPVRISLGASPIRQMHWGPRELEVTLLNGDGGLIAISLAIRDGRLMPPPVPKERLRVPGATDFDIAVDGTIYVAAAEEEDEPQAEARIEVTLNFGEWLTEIAPPSGSR